MPQSALKARSLSGTIDLAWGFGAFFLQFGTALIVLPALLHFLSPEELGLWYAYQVAARIALLLEFGYQGTFARNITYVANGAQSLQFEGVAEPSAEPRGETNWQLMASLLDFMRHKYRQIAFAILAVLCSAGTAYVLYVGRSQPVGEVVSTWLLFVAFTVAAFALGRYTVLLTGLNRVRSTQQFQVFARLISVACILAFLWAGAGLAGAVVGYGIGSVAAPLFARWAWRRQEAHERTSGLKAAMERKALDPLLWHNARKVGSVAVGSFLAQRATSLVASAFLPLAEFASFSLTLQIVQLITQFARVKFQISLPSLVGYAGRSDLQAFRGTFMSCMAMAWMIYLVGIAGLLLFGSQVLVLLSSSIPLLSPGLILMLGLLYLFEVTYGNCAWALTCFNVVPFVAATWITGTVIAASSLLIGAFTDWGVAGFVAVQLVSHLMYNVWKWPVELAARCGGSFRLGGRAS